MIKGHHQITNTYTVIPYNPTCRYEIYNIKKHRQHKQRVLPNRDGSDGQFVLQQHHS